MEIIKKDILVLGGWGMVGTAICRKLFQYSPNSITISSLTKEQAESACHDLAAEAGSVDLKPAWGNIFVRSEFKDLSRNEILNNQEHRVNLASDVLERTDATSFKRFFLYDLIVETKPQIIIDCVNLATGLAYQDVYSIGLKVQKGLAAARRGSVSSELLEDVETLLCSLYLPQLIRHVQILYQAMKDAGTKTYVKVGTSGTGGMGLNIPYTHSEDKPSRVLLSKACVGGAHSLLLFLMGRTPDAPYTKEIKPATAIAWKRIDHGKILRGGKPIPLFDCSFEEAPVISEVLDTEESRGCVALGENLEGVFIDTGENGTFSLGEFTAITTHEQMEYITPEEIAQTIIWEIEGGASGHDVVAALDASVLGSTYRAGVMRALAIEKMRELIAGQKDEVPAFELLGPPRLSKLLYEAHLLKKVAVSLNGVMAVSPEELSEKVTRLVMENKGLRSRIVSIGIPILMPDGRKLLKGPVMKVPHDPRQSKFNVKLSDIENWSSNGWVDLRVSNMTRWQERIDELRIHTQQVHPEDTSSRSLRDATFWHADEPLDEGELVGWIFIYEDKGRRMK